MFKNPDLVFIWIMATTVFLCSILWIIDIFKLINYHKTHTNMLDTIGKAYITLYEWSMNNKSWIKQYTAITTDEIIKIQIDKYLSGNNETMDFYRFDCYNSEGVFQGTLYTTHIWLFDKT